MILNRLIFVALGLTIISCNPNKKKNSLSEMNLIGKVKSIKETSYKAIDKFGNISKANKDRGSEYDYDTYSIFNDDGNLIEEIHYKSDGTKVLKIKYEYDNNELKKEKATYNLDGTLKEKDIYDYNSDGNTVAIKTYNSDGDNKYKIEYKYENRNVTEEVMQDFDFEENRFCYVGRYTYTYDKNNYLIEKTSFNFNNKLEYKWFYKYDNKQNLLEQVFNNVQESYKIITTYLYEFDTKGNWVKRIEFSNSIPEYILEREIEYY